MGKRRKSHHNKNPVKKQKVTPPLLSKKRTLPDAPRKRVRKTEEKQTILPKEKEIISTFGREFTPLSSLLTAHKLGRTSAWVKKQQESLIKKKKVKLPSQTSLLSDLLKVKGKNNRILKHMSKGCELMCNGTGPLVTCPSCKRFQFHVDCLQNILLSLKMPTVDVAQKWKCPHC